MYTSYLTRETFENEHDEKMTRKFSYNYQVLKRLFPEVYKLPEREIRSLVHSIYDNPKLGDELLDHLTDVINKRKPEWGEYLNPKPEEPEQSAQSVQQNPLQPVQPKSLNTSSGFEPYKPQKSAFGLSNSSGFGQTKLPDLTKGMDLKHSDMVTGFGINEDKQKEMLGTGFQMPKLPKMPQFPKAPEPQMPELPQMLEISQALQIQPMQQYPQIQLAYSAYNNQSSMPLTRMQNNNDVKERLLNLNTLSNKPSLQAVFDGQRFIVKDENNNIYGDFGAMSGNRQYQYKNATNEPNMGPIPEGNWLLKYSDIEDFKMPYDKQPDFLNSWGRRRIRLTPLLPPEQRFGRDGFYLHGSYNGLGSAGCVDLGLEMPGFSRIIDTYGKDIPVTVKYKADSW